MKERFQLIQILGLLGMYFDAWVVEVEKYLFFLQIGYGHTVLCKAVCLRNYSNCKPREQYYIDYRIEKQHYCSDYVAVAGPTACT